jgi:hypothetical protein
MEDRGWSWLRGFAASRDIFFLSAPGAGGDGEGFLLGQAAALFALLKLLGAEVFAGHVSH